MNTVFITGATSGIGEKTAEVFAKNNWAIILGGRNAQKAASLSEQCTKLGAPRAHFVQMDYLDEASIPDAALAVRKFVGKEGLTTFVNSAGRLISAPVGQLTKSQWDEMDKTNFYGPLIMTYQLIAKGLEPRFIYLGTDLGYKREDLVCADYAHIKNGLRAEIEKLGKRGLSTYCVNPDTTATPMTGGKGRPAIIVAKIIYQTALNGFGKPGGSNIDVWEILGEKPLGPNDPVPVYD